jgi:hypothetical protein
MLYVDQGCVRRFGLVVPLARGRLPAGVLRGGDNLKVLVFQLFVEFLPARQIEAASSPGRPRDH